MTRKMSTRIGGKPQDFLRNIGRAVYGQSWKTALAEEADGRFSLRSVHLWADGSTEPPEQLRQYLLGLLRRRILHMRSLEQRLQREDPWPTTRASRNQWADQGGGGDAVAG